MKLFGTVNIRRARHKNTRERAKFVLIELASILDAAITLLSLSLVSSDFRAALLFTEFWEGD